MLASEGVDAGPVLGYLTPLAPQGLTARDPAGEWCNGNTAVFGTVVLGSSPSSPASLSRRCACIFARRPN